MYQYFINDFNILLLYINNLLIITIMILIFLI